MHPLSGTLDEFKDSELESKIGDLTKKYFMTHNTEVKSQISMLLGTYNEELTKRRQNALKQMMNLRDKSLDKLINVS
jgi:putative salt-induced outer membrane protein YdiY